MKSIICGHNNLSTAQQYIAITTQLCLKLRTIQLGPITLKLTIKLPVTLFKVCNIITVTGNDYFGGVAGPLFLQGGVEVQIQPDPSPSTGKLRNLVNLFEKFEIFASSLSN